MIGNNHNTFKKLRKQYPVFTYEDFTWDVKDNVLHLGYHFNLADAYHFHPTLAIPLQKWTVKKLDNSLIRNIAFNIGMVEMISYWKTACPAHIRIKPYQLGADQQQWWKKLFYLGLGEFFHVNAIRVDKESLFSFSFSENTRLLPRNFSLPQHDGVIIPVGGGKDSLVSLDILSKTDIDKIALAINPGQATLESVEIAGLSDRFIQVKRTLDPLLLQLNKQGFLNGHTPFSAIVAFVSLMVASFTGSRFVALSNESSANEPTIAGTEINHQYSKSIDFENDFRRYVMQYITPDVNYFSLLRPLNELQIAALFAKNPSFFTVFRSCNVGSKTNSWCCNCPKCLFTYIMLSAFINTQQLIDIFGENLLEKESLIPLLEQLAGLTDEKPFECIGTIDEVNSALAALAQNYPQDKRPLLLQHHARHTSDIRFLTLDEQLKSWNNQHNLYFSFEKILKENLNPVQE